jgi:hypothetical protein
MIEIINLSLICSYETVLDKEDNGTSVIMLKHKLKHLVTTEVSK